MKKTTKNLITLLAAVAMLLPMAACGGEAGKSDASLMQGIFDKLTANADYGNPTSTPRRSRKNLTATAFSSPPKVKKA